MSTGPAFGDQLSCQGNITDPHHFTGKERDTESGNDSFGARYYTSDMGRFLTPDWAAKPAGVPYASFGDPQTLNLYSYVENGPLNRVDAEGHASNQDGSSGLPVNMGEGCVSFSDPRPDCSASFLSDTPEVNAAEAAYNAQVQQAFASAGNRMAQQQSASGATVNDRRLISVSGTNGLALTPLVEHYLVGSATDYTLSDDAFNSFVAEMQKDGRLGGDLTQAPGMPDGVMQQQVNTYNTSYALAVGSTTLYYMGGKTVGYRDYWDFDSKPWGQRPISAEIETRTAGGVMDAVGGRPFWVDYGIHPY